MRTASSKNVELISQSDQGGRPDGAQIMVHRGYAYIGHLFSSGVTVMDVRDLKRPKPVNFLAAFRNDWNIALQTHDDLLLVIDEYNFYADPHFAKGVYYGQSVEDSIKQAGGETILGERGVDYSAGMSLYDISKPDRPRKIGQMEIDGYGFHRIWYVGGRYAYVSAQLRGYTDHIFMIVDISNPERPFEVSRWWLPGMWSGGGEKPFWSKGDRVALHHAVVANNIAYGSWRDGGLTLIDVADAANPKLLAHSNWHPPFGGGTHTAVPLTERVPRPKDYVIVADESIAEHCTDQVKYTWVIDVRDKTKPINVSTLPTPSERDYCAEAGRFGPLNLHENRPGAFQSSDIIFGTYQNAGLRAFDVSNPLRPEQVAFFVPGPPSNSARSRFDPPGAIDSCDAYVDANGIIYLTDFSGGLHILEFKGA